MESPGALREISLTCSAQQAFEAFVEQTDAWWIPRLTNDPEDSAALAIGPLAGSQVVEFGPGGQEVVRGDVLAWDPGRYVEFTFAGSQAGSGERRIRVTFEHTGDDSCDVRFEQDGGEPFAWDELIDRYARYADAKGTGEFPS